MPQQPLPATETTQVVLTRVGQWLLAPLLTIGSFFYWVGLKLRLWAYQSGIFKRKKVPVYVVSVGNINTGGSGKTPMSIYLIQRCLQRGIQPAYLSRGYGRNSRGYKRVEPMVSTAREVGDEAAMIATRFPHIPVAVAEDRAAGAAKLLEETPFQVLILDDAFQHWGIHRDLDIVMLPASLKPWQKLLLPAGNLREPASALKRADLVVVNRIKSEAQRRHLKGSLYKRKLYKNQLEPNVCFTHYIPSRLVPFSPSFPQILINRIGKRACLAFSGLANNSQFAEDLQEIGFLIIDHLSYPDHYAYLFADWKYITKRFKKATGKESYTESPIIVTTEKDYQRLHANDWFQREAASYPIYYLETELEIVNGLAQFDVVFDELLQIVSKNSSNK